MSALSDHIFSFAVRFNTGHCGYIVSGIDKDSADRYQKTITDELDRVFGNSSKGVYPIYFKQRVEGRSIIISFGEKYCNLTHVHESKDPQRIWWVDIVAFKQVSVDSWEAQYHCRGGWLNEKKRFGETIFKTSELIGVFKKSLRRDEVMEYLRYQYRERF